MRVTKKLIEKYDGSPRFEVIMRGNECIVLDKNSDDYQRIYDNTMEGFENGDTIAEIQDMNKSIEEMSKYNSWC